MISFIEGFNPVIQALLATCFTWFVTAAGASAVFFVRTLNQKILDTMLGFAAGVMIAASYWSLLAPAIEMSAGRDMPEWFPAVVGFMGGAVVLRIIDKILPHLHRFAPTGEAEGLKTAWKRSTLLILAITLHNFPEGLAVGVAFGAVAYNLDSATLAGAISLAFGIGLQNFPEGMAVSVPLRREGVSRLKSFWYGQLSGAVEPLAGIIGAYIVMTSHAILPYSLSFAAGAMIFVTVEQLIPESHRHGNTDFATMGAMTGFTVMMFLDVALG